MFPASYSSRVKDGDRIYRVHGVLRLATDGKRERVIFSFGRRPEETARVNADFIIDGTWLPALVERIIQLMHERPFLTLADLPKVLHASLSYSTMAKMLALLPAQARKYVFEQANEIAEKARNRAVDNKSSPAG